MGLWRPICAAAAQLPAFALLVLSRGRHHACCAGLGKAKHQLRLAANIYVWLLLNANPQLAAGKEVQVSGTIYVAGRLTFEERWRCERRLGQVSMSVSCPGLPAKRRVVMQLRLKEV